MTKDHSVTSVNSMEPHQNGQESIVLIEGMTTNQSLGELDLPRGVEANNSNRS